MDNNLKSYIECLDKVTKSCKSFVIITITSIKGSAPQDLGAKLIFGNNEILYGTVGGGKVEARCIEFANELIANKDSQKISKTWNLQKDIGMTCGGEVSFLFEPFGDENNWNIAIFGAGHVSQALVRALLPLDCNVTVIDNRKEWLDKLPESNSLNKVFTDNLANEVYRLNYKSFVVSMTMGHSHDVPILEKALKDRRFPYIGVIGSKSKKSAIIKELRALNVSEESLEGLVCPIGDDIGTNTPPEIAISIISQFLKVRDSKTI